MPPVHLASLCSQSRLKRGTPPKNPKALQMDFVLDPFNGGKHVGGAVCLSSGCFFCKALPGMLWVQRPLLLHWKNLQEHKSSCHQVKNLKALQECLCLGSPPWWEACWRGGMPLFSLLWLQSLARCTGGMRDQSFHVKNNVKTQN